MIEDFWDWLPKAYGEVGDEPVFTKYDMEVAFAAGAETEGKRIEQAEQAEQAQPVAWATSLDFNDDDQEIIPAKDKGKLGTSNYDIPLYTAPLKREWVGLTDEEVSEVIDNVLEGGGWLDVARALEAAIKEKNA